MTDGFTVIGVRQHVSQWNDRFLNRAVTLGTGVFDGIDLDFDASPHTTPLSLRGATLEFEDAKFHTAKSGHEVIVASFVNHVSGIRYSNYLSEARFIHTVEQRRAWSFVTYHALKRAIEEMQSEALG